MKVIDLLNKIANEGEYPKIKFNNSIYEYHDKEHGYCRHYHDNTYICLNDDYYLFDILNDEVEILEEKPTQEEIKEYTNKFLEAWIPVKKQCGKLFDEIARIGNILDLEDELEEQKKIPEKIEYYDDSIAWVIDDVGQISDVDKVIIDKLNEVIDYLKSKGE